MKFFYYLNFLKMKGLLVFSFFGLADDWTGLDLFNKVYEDEKIVAIDCNEIAQQGGVLNCISWNIKT